MIFNLSKNDLAQIAPHDVIWVAIAYSLEKTQIIPCKVIDLSDQTMRVRPVVSDETRWQPDLIINWQRVKSLTPIDLYTRGTWVIYKKNNRVMIYEYANADGTHHLRDLDREIDVYQNDLITIPDWLDDSAVFEKYLWATTQDLSLLERVQQDSLKQIAQDNTFSYKILSAVSNEKVLVKCDMNLLLRSLGVFDLITLEQNAVIDLT